MKILDSIGGLFHNVTKHGPDAVGDVVDKAAGAVVGATQNVTKGAAELALSQIFPRVIPNRERASHPDWLGAVAWEARTSDLQRVNGWACPGRTGKGTVFLLHGFSEHSMSGQVVGMATRVRESHGLALVALDTRHHGRSDNRAPTFGTAEMWDTQAAMTWAEANGYPKPFILCGYSLGAMAANRTAITDMRVRGAFLQSPPQCPWDAIGVALQKAVVAAAPAINAAYDSSGILGDGDIRKHPCSPGHAPFICMAIGERDHYGIDKTKLIYSHWYGGQRGTFERWPGANPEDRTWFITFAGADHGFGLHTHPQLGKLLDTFLHRVLVSAE